MESTLHSIITLSTGRITETARYVYLRFLKRRYIPEDCCADLFEQLVRRLKGYRDRNPEVKKIEKRLVKNCVNWIVKKIRAKSRSDTRDESALVDAIKQEVGTLDAVTHKPLLKKYEKRICRLLAGKIKEGKLKRRHVLFFVLYHACEARPEFSARLLRAAGLNTAVNRGRLRRIRRSIQKKTGERRERLVRSIERNYLAIRRAQQALDSTCSREQKACYRGRLEKASRARKNSFDRLARVRVVPPVRALAVMLKQPYPNVFYGIRRVENLVLKHVKEKEAAA
ncbi:MAG: hypothetical protein JW874_16035 [Spirochaetales bacterium]|nr:hypothetical protein [Spirochaetales bacterium]